MSRTRSEKNEILAKLWDFIEAYPQVVVADYRHSTSSMLLEVRRALRGKAEVLFAKNTLIKAGLKMLLQKPGHRDEESKIARRNPIQKLEVLGNLCKGQVCLIFCDDTVNDVLGILKSARVPTEALAGSRAPYDIVLPAGLEVGDPTSTSYCGYLGIATKIVRGKLTIISDITLIQAGQIVGKIEAGILTSHGIKPYTRGIDPVAVYDRGSVYDPAVVSEASGQVRKMLVQGVHNIKALSLTLDMPCQAFVPGSLVIAYFSLLEIEMMLNLAS
mmetsp:Transcript_23160/g.41289  ORF Transcript_23160/g.41289 Transcript_23160/m.41289 type:complete len:273 (-) Transcript_23160:218-1036(-)